MIVWFMAAVAAASPDCESVLRAMDIRGADCGTHGLMSAAAIAQREGLQHCLTPALGARGLGSHPVSGSAQAAATGKALRDAYGTPSLYETPNFAIRWGSTSGFTEADVERLANTFEDSWVVQIDDLGFPQPQTSDTYKFNVYIGDTGQGAPSSYGAGGYFYLDTQGYPMIVIAAASLAEALYADTAGAHEFNHAVQYASTTYSYEGQGAWYWEATASWAAGEVYPTNPYYAVYLPGTAYLPELQVNFFDYPDTGTMQEYHQYGAFLFVRYISEVAADSELVARSWVEAPVFGDPLAVLDDLLAEHGTDVETSFVDYANRMATWDFEDGATYEDWITAWGGWSSPDSHRPTGTIQGTTDGWVSPSAHEPYTYGINYWELDGVPDVAEVAFEGDDTPEAWHVSVATRTADVHEQHPLTMEGHTGSAVITGLDDVDEAWLVVAVVDGFSLNGPTFSYAVHVAESTAPPEDTGDTGDTGTATPPGDTAPPPGGEDTGSEPPSVEDSGVVISPGGCGCDHVTPLAPLATGWLALWVVGRRRQASAGSPS